MASAGPNSAGAGANSAVGGNPDWVNPGDVVSSNNVYATCSMASGQDSDDLFATQFGFSIPAGATIDGVECTIEAKCDISQGLWEDSTVGVRHRLIVGGSKVGSAPTALGSSYGTSDTSKTWGSSTDLWGATPTAAQVNATDFGVSVGFGNPGPLAIVGSIDHVTLTVYYTEGVQPMSKRLGGNPFSVTNSGRLPSIQVW